MSGADLNRHGAVGISEAARYRKRFADSGWSVAIHNDYRLDGKPMTFWLFTKPLASSACRESGWFVKGEGVSDDEALRQAWAALEAFKTRED
jgi:hypothetical protein